MQPRTLTADRTADRTAHWAALRAAQLVARGHSAHVQCTADLTLETWLKHASHRWHDETGGTTVSLQPSADRHALWGGLDLEASIKLGRAVQSVGRLYQANTLFVIRMAERWPPGTLIEVLQTLQQQAYLARSNWVLIDESIPEHDESLAPLIHLKADLAVNLRGLALQDCENFAVDHGVAQQPIEAGLQPAELSADQLHALTAQWATQLGVDHLGVMVATIKAQRALVALGYSSPEAFGHAVSLCMASRATRWPEPEVNQDPNDEPSKPAGDEQASDQSQDQADSEVSIPPQVLDDLVLAAVAASLPPDLLKQLQSGSSAKAIRPPNRPVASQGSSGAKRTGHHRGRRIGVQRRARYGQRPDLLATIQAALPWQRLRRSLRNTHPPSPVLIETSDFRYPRYQHKQTSLLLFVVDASGSAAIGRLAETKGAVELLMAQSYARRDEVALIAFRGLGAEICLEPTRSLTRAKRQLAGLPGGGSTPIAAGIDLAHSVSEKALRQGCTPYLILLTDGKANLTRQGHAGRQQAQQEAYEAARRFATLGLAGLVIDTSPLQVGERPAQALAQQMRLPFIALPRTGAEELASRVKSHR